MKAVTIFAIICCVTYTSALKEIFPLHNIIRALSLFKAVDRTPPEIKEELKNLNSSEHSTRVVGGKPCRPNQFPYQVLFISEFNGYLEWCGGSLITQNYVLTAAHCVYGATDLVVYIGAHDRSVENETNQISLYIDSDSIFKHENYDPKFVRNDIALIKLPEPVQLSYSAQPVKLADESLNITGITGIATGWGLTKEDGQTSDILQYVNLEVIPNEKCAKYYPMYIQPTNFCTDSSTGRSTCRGDSGGPLVVKHNGSYVQIGLTSFGSKKGCESGRPAVQTKISSFLKWIVEHSDYKL